MTRNTIFVTRDAKGEVLACKEGLSFWGGVDPDTGVIIDAHHPDFGATLAGRIVLMPTSRGSCSGSGVLLQLARSGSAPAALVFREDEEILTPRRGPASGTDRLRQIGDGRHGRDYT